MKKLKVLITCGATWVAIDDVRVISNISSGEMGHVIAQAFSAKKADVTILEGPVTHALTDKKIKIIKYFFFDELAATLKKELVKNYDIVIHAAAISDFKVKGASKSKISSQKTLSLDLIATPKIINDIKRLSPKSFLVGFKLETKFNLNEIFKEVRSLFTDSCCDLVVANTLKGGYKGYIIDADGKIMAQVSSKEQVAQHLVKLII